MGLNTVKVQGINVTTDDEKTILEFIKRAVSSGRSARGKIGISTGKCLTIVTPNPEQVMYAHGHAWYRDILNSADINAPDGIGLLIADRLAGSGKIKARIPGVDFMNQLVTGAAKEGVSIGLIGSRSGVALKAFECLRITHPKLKGWAVDGPALDLRDARPVFSGGEGGLTVFLDSVIRKIRTTKTRYVFIGLGVPKQEWLMEKLVSRYAESNTGHTIVCMVVGGAFDMVAGIVPRAPKMLRAIGFEWLWRLIIEPWRWKRQLVLARFFFNSLTGYR